MEAKLVWEAAGARQAVQDSPLPLKVSTSVAFGSCVTTQKPYSCQISIRIDLKMNFANHSNRSLFLANFQSKKGENNKMSPICSPSLRFAACSPHALPSTEPLSPEGSTSLGLRENKWNMSVSCLHEIRTASPTRVAGPILLALGGIWGWEGT